MIEDRTRPQTDTAPAHPMTCARNEPEAFCAQDIHGWFELSYSSYLVLPRSLMQFMPAAWQHQMVELLERMHEEFPGEHSSYTVLKKGERNRFERDPLRNYRYPDSRTIEAARCSCQRRAAEPCWHHEHEWRPASDEGMAHMRCEPHGHYQKEEPG